MRSSQILETCGEVGIEKVEVIILEKFDYEKCSERVDTENSKGCVT